MAARRPRPCDGAARSRRGGGPRWLESSDRRATRVGAPSRRSRIPRGRDDVAWVVGWRRMGPRHAAGWGGGRRRDRGANRCARRSGRPRGPLHVRRFRLSGRFPPSGFTDRPSRAGTRSPRGHPARARRAGGGRRSHRRPGTPAHLEASPSRLVASRIRVHRDEAGNSHPVTWTSSVRSWCQSQPGSSSSGRTFAVRRSISATGSWTAYRPS